MFAPLHVLVLCTIPYHIVVQMCDYVIRIGLNQVILQYSAYIIIVGAVTVVLALHYTRKCTGRAGFDFEKRSRNDCRTIGWGTGGIKTVLL